MFERQRLASIIMFDRNLKYLILYGLRSSATSLVVLFTFHSISPGTVRTLDRYTAISLFNLRIFRPTTRDRPVQDLERLREKNICPRPAEELLSLSAEVIQWDIKYFNGDFIVLLLLLLYTCARSKRKCTARTRHA